MTERTLEIDTPRQPAATGPSAAEAADSPPAIADEAADTATTGRLYAVVWRWHFYAGLITAPIMLIVVVTGALYVFRTELTA